MVVGSFYISNSARVRQASRHQESASFAFNIGTNSFFPFFPFSISNSHGAPHFSGLLGGTTAILGIIISACQPRLTSLFHFLSALPSSVVEFFYGSVLYLHHLAASVSPRLKPRQEQKTIFINSHHFIQHRKCLCPVLLSTNIEKKPSSLSLHVLLWLVTREATNEEPEEERKRRKKGFNNGSS